MAVGRHGHRQASVVVSATFKVRLIVVFKGEIGIAGGMLGRKHGYGSIHGLWLALSEGLELEGSVGHLVLHLRS